MAGSIPATAPRPKPPSRLPALVAAAVLPRDVKEQIETKNALLEIQRRAFVFVRPLFGGPAIPMRDPKALRRRIAPGLLFQRG